MKILNVIRYIVFGILFFQMELSFAQDPIYSQFYNAHLQLNPALAGNTRGPLIQLNYRNQWPGLNNIYTTYSVSYDQFVEKLNGGLGVMLMSDDAGDGTLKNTGINGFYSYRLKLKDDTYIKGGIQAGFHSLNLDWSKLQFGDGISPTGIPLPSAEVNPGNNSQKFLNVGAGVVFYNPQHYIGISLNNLNTPNISFIGNTGTDINGVNTLPIRLSIHAGTQKVLKKGNKDVDPTFISPNIIFLKQSGYYQFNLGAYLSVNKVQAGLWYRHSLYNGDAMIASVGVKKDFLKLTYSFDYTVSQLGINQGGSHEISIGFNFDYLYPKKQNYNDCFAIFR